MSKKPVNKKKSVKKTIKNHKSTAAEVQKRELIIYGFLVSGMRRETMFQNAIVKRWGVTPARIDDYIAKAKAQIQETIIPLREDFIRDSMAKLDELYQANLKKGMTSECRLIVSTKNKILGFERLTLTVNNNSKEKQIKEMTDKELDLELESLDSERDERKKAINTPGETDKEIEKKSS